MTHGCLDFHRGVPGRGRHKPDWTIRILKKNREKDGNQVATHIVRGIDTDGDSGSDRPPPAFRGVDHVSAPAGTPDLCPGQALVPTRTARASASSCRMR
jgi:hypothetical protein